MTGRPRPLSLRRGEQTTAYLLMLPAAAVLTLFLAVPFGMAFYLSLTNQRLISPNPTEFVGLANYRRLLGVKVIRLEPLKDGATGEVLRDEAGRPQYLRARTVLRANEAYANLRQLSEVDLFGRRYLVAAGDPVFLRSVFNNFYFVVVVVPVQTSFALLLALLVNQKLRGMNAFRTIYFSPVVTTMAVVAVLWFFLYNPDEGLINAVFGLFGLGPYAWLTSPTTAMPAIMLLSIWQGVGFQMVIFLAGLQDIPDTLYEASALDGANPWQRFRFVTLPSLRNTTLFVAISSTILAFKLFTQVEVMTFGTGGPADSTVTMALHMVNQGFGQQQIGYASAIAVFFVVLVLLIALVQHYLLRQEAA